jgi:hypothetical protein
MWLLGMPAVTAKRAGITTQVSHAPQHGSSLASPAVADVPQVNSHLFPTSCAWAVVNPMITGRYWTVMPVVGYEKSPEEQGSPGLFTILTSIL